MIDTLHNRAALLHVTSVKQERLSFSISFFVRMFATCACGWRVEISDHEDYTHQSEVHRVQMKDLEVRRKRLL